MSLNGRLVAWHVGGMALVTVTLACLYALTYRGEVASADEAYMFGLTHDMAEHHTIAVDDFRWLNDRVPGGKNGPDGHFYTKLGLGQSLLGLPSYEAGKRWLHLDGNANFAGYEIGPRSGVRGAMATGSVIAIFVALGAYALAALLGAGPRGAAVAALATGAGSMLWPYAKTYFSEPAAALGVVWAVTLFVWHEKRPAAWKPVVGALFVDLAAVVRPFNLALALPLVLYALWVAARRDNRRASSLGSTFAMVVVVGVGAISVAAYNLARFGSPLATGYGANEGFHHDIAQGLLGFAISPGKGLLLFDLPVVAALAGVVIAWRNRQAATVVVIVVVNMLYATLYSAWWAWEGGWAWGPRFLLPIVPLLMALAGLAMQRLPALVIGAALAVGSVVSVAGALYDPISAIGEVVGGGLPEGQYPWSWRHSYVFAMVKHALNGEHVDSLWLSQHAILPAWLLLLGIVGVAGAIAGLLPAASQRRS